MSTEKFDNKYSGYPTFYGTVVDSKEWRAWEHDAHKHGFDWSESTECGWLSPRHFKEFIRWIKKSK